MRWKEPWMETRLSVKWTVGKVSVCHTKLSVHWESAFQKAAQSHFISPLAPPYCLRCNDWFWEFSSFFLHHLCTLCFSSGDWRSMIWAEADSPLTSSLLSFFLPKRLSGHRATLYVSFSGSGLLYWLSWECGVRKLVCSLRTCHRCCLWLWDPKHYVVLSSLNIIKNLMGIMSNSSQGDLWCRE